MKNDTQPPRPASCSEHLCATLDRLGVPRESKWRGLILYMRSIKEYDFLDAAQKELIQKLVVSVLKGKDFSEARFRELVRQNERILHDPWRRKMAATLKETAKLVGEMYQLFGRRRGDVEDLEATTVQAVESGKEIEEVIGNIRTGFRDMLAIMEKDVDILQELSLTDALTGIGNRRAFDQLAGEALETAGRLHDPLSLLMIDIDHFKVFNDEHGHRIGDQALATVGSLLKDFAEDYATKDGVNVTPTRYGGEEFTVVLPGVAKEQAGEMADILRSKIGRYHFVIRDVGGQIVSSGIKIKVSIGVAELLTDCGMAADLAHLVDAADKALYQAKAQGRDRVCLYDPSLSSESLRKKNGRA
ncbi:GGDEF domain-containing protein [Desulfolutivibrio sulfoxidireducens]|uniref:GGDEF domain-containing protein n=1 Tax=Desulfolutivibrio sulfoxidireducens TaxID=2773299 RepID=UPI00159D0C53|nr:GGDEF domain-containing protein [Desulfolutivibrio sulfoxidireducens]QLA14968.1 diguanylate cyclase [Desulfolutivibrio sulfoxidireducens]QLA18535.1 diguanylate cyclase [Desulfolutivibrio sulfoxidireducens]